MIKGEWLLTMHRGHKSLYRTPSKRRQLLHKDLLSANATIEGMSLRGMNPDEVATPTHHGSQTEYIACTYAEEERTLKLEIAEQLIRLDKQLSTLQNYLCLFDSAMEGLDAREVWVIKQYYICGCAFEALAAEQAPDGKYYAATTLRRHKKMIILKVHQLVLAIEGNTEIERMPD